MMGSKTSQIDAGIRTSGKKLKKLGNTRSENSTRNSKVSSSFIVLDYAHTVNNLLPILIIADPGFEPTYAKTGDAGADLRSRISTVIAAGERQTLPTGVSIAIPAGYVGLVHPRSGLASKHGITVLNAPGTVDAGYRGEISVTLFNSSVDDFEINAGDRIAQLVFQQFEQAKFIAVEHLPDSDRGAGGFGSTGR